MHSSIVLLKNECCLVHVVVITELANIILDYVEVEIRIDVVLEPACITDAKKK